MKKLTRLFEPIKIGTMEVKNRIVMTGFAITDQDDTNKVGMLHRKYRDFYEERAKDGVGLIILPDTTVDATLRFQCHPCISHDKYNPGFSATTEAVHMWGAKIAPDLWHCGYRVDRYWQENLPPDFRPLAPSALQHKEFRSKEMNLEEIELVEQQFVDAALRSKRTGFDALHFAGHFGNLIAQFMSPRFNKRTDKYGGKLENRMRFALEIIEKTRKAVGNMPLIFRMSADEFIDGGLRIKDTRVIARILEEAGIDCLNVAAGLDLVEKYHLNMIPMGFPQGLFVDLGAEIKKAVKIPVIIVGRITDPVFAEKVLEEGKADMIAMTRQLAADPGTPIKAYEGRFDDIVPCIGCNICLQSIMNRTESRCSVNAAMGREREMRIVLASTPKKVMIIGAGCAGMEAARVAALRGHKVTIFEKQKKLGGQFLISMQPPHKDEIKQYLTYLKGQVKKLGISVKTGVTVTPKIVANEKPDVVIVATGAKPCIPEIPGVHKPNVLSAWDVLSGKPTGKRVIIAGGGMVGCETAEYLITQGKDVTIVEMLPKLAMDVEATNRSALMERFASYKYASYVDSTVVEITSKGLVINQEGKRKELRGDSVVIAMGAVADNALASSLRNSGKEVHIIGDCAKPAPDRGRSEPRLLHSKTDLTWVKKLEEWQV